MIPRSGAKCHGQARSARPLFGVFFAVLRVPPLFRLGSINRVPVLVHWSVPLVAGVMIIAGLDHIITTIAGITAYLLLIIIHELGHQFLASRLGYGVVSVEIYPVHGICRFDHPETKLDAAIIAWGGVVGQMFMAIPMIVRLVIWGDSRFSALNALLEIGGPMNAVIAVFNLIPIRPLDGATAWSLMPLLWARWRKRRKPEKTALEVFEEIVEKSKRR